MAIKIAINGFGRIGRAAFKAALKNNKVEIVAINDLMDNKSLAYLLQYDSAYGTYNKKVIATVKGLKVNGKEYKIFSEKDPANLPWQELKVDFVLECTGIFKTKESVQGHLTAGAKKVIISAPAKDDSQTFVCGTNFTNKSVKKSRTPDVISNASCTTNCISPVMQVLESAFGIEKALMTTVHAYTSTQNLVDGPNKDLRRARAAAVNMIPTTTGAAIATTKVVPSLDKKFDGMAIRVPVITGSLADITAVLKRKNVTVEQINNAFKKASKTPEFKNILAVSNEPLVSSDFIGNTYSATVDLEFTKVVGGNLVKVLAWYDNEIGYATRLIDLAVSINIK